jgi:hypothetical protein
MVSLTATPGPVKPSRPKPPRRATLGAAVNGVYPLLVTVGTGDKAQRFGYYIEAMPCDFGQAFRFVMLAHQVEEGQPDHYDVRLDSRGRHSCECLGHLRHGHKTACRHVAACVALMASGRLPVTPAVGA